MMSETELANHILEELLRGNVVYTYVQGDDAFGESYYKWYPKEGNFSIVNIDPQINSKISYPKIIYWLAVDEKLISEDEYLIQEIN